MKQPEEPFVFSPFLQFLLINLEHTLRDLQFIFRMTWGYRESEMRTNRHAVSPAMKFQKEDGEWQDNGSRLEMMRQQAMTREVV